MKTTIRLVFFSAALSLGLTGCSDFLDVEPESVFTDLIIGEQDEGAPKYSTKQDMDLLLADIYAGFRSTISNFYNLDLPMLTDVRSDNAYAGSIEGWALELDNFSISPSNTVTSRSWGEHYAMIGKANVIIDNIDAIADPEMTSDLKKRYKAEAKILRGMMYFDLVRMYGAVPLVLQETPDITSDNISEIYPLLYPSRAEVAQVYGQIVEDLEEGALNGPEASPSGDKFKLTRAFACGLLAKVHATMPEKDWSKVDSYCDDVIAVGYDLADNYEDLWSAGSQNTIESIFEISYSNELSNWGYDMFLGTAWRKFCTPTHDLEAAFMSEGEEGDLIRKNASIKVEACTWDNWWPASSYRFMNKLRTKTNSWIVMRLADILLLKAEARVELDDLSGAAGLVEQVRSRVGLPALTAADKASKESMRRAIERERRLELAFEGHRWFDLLRTGRALEVMRAWPDQNGVQSLSGIEEWMLLLPVPQSERDANSNLDQNPGY